MKCLVTTVPVIYYYNPKAELEIQCDTNKKGLGAALLQRGKLIAYTSRALTETEQRLGTGNDRYHEILGLEKYDYEVQYECGMNQYLADALSRAYLPTTLHPTRAEFENINATAFLLYPHLDSEKSSRQLRMTRYCKP